MQNENSNINNLKKHKRQSSIDVTSPEKKTPKLLNSRPRSKASSRRSSVSNFSLKAKRPKLTIEILVDRIRFDDCWELFLSYDTLTYKEHSTIRNLSKTEVDDLKKHIYGHFLSCIKHTYFRVIKLYKLRVDADDDRRF